MTKQSRLLSKLLQFLKFKFSTPTENDTAKLYSVCELKLYVECEKFTIFLGF